MSRCLLLFILSCFFFVLMRRLIEIAGETISNSLSFITFIFIFETNNSFITFIWTFFIKVNLLSIMTIGSHVQVFTNIFPCLFKSSLIISTFSLIFLISGISLIGWKVLFSWEFLLSFNISLSISLDVSFLSLTYQ